MIYNYYLFCKVGKGFFRIYFSKNNNCKNVYNEIPFW